MSNAFDFSNTKNSFLSVIMSLGYIALFCYLSYSVALKQELDYVLRTFAITVILSMGIGFFRVLFRVNFFSLDWRNSRILNMRGTALYFKKHQYPLSDVRQVELRRHVLNESTLEHKKAGTSRTVYFPVLVLNDDELYLKGSSNKDDAEENCSVLAGVLGKKFLVNLDGKANSKQSELNPFRLVSLLSIFLLCAVAIYYTLLRFF